MPDREKIESLKQCLSASCRGFRNCPYNDTVWNAVETVLELLADQEPVKPIAEGKRPYRWFRCGNCEGPLYGPWNYCPKCGKAVDWDA